MGRRGWTKDYVPLSAATTVSVPITSWSSAVPLARLNMGVSVCWDKWSSSAPVDLQMLGKRVSKYGMGALA